MMTESKTLPYKLRQHVNLNDDKTDYEQDLQVSFIEKNDVYLRYIEALDEHEIKVTVRLANDHVKLQRRGIINMNFHFEEGLKTDTFYESPAGKHHFQVYTHRLLQSVDTLIIEYDLYQSGELLGNYKYKLERV